VRHFTFAVVSTIALAALLVGCGSDDDTVGPVQPTATPTVTPRPSLIDFPDGLGLLRR
jgi:hypothetical protein